MIRAAKGREAVVQKNRRPKVCPLPAGTWSQNENFQGLSGRISRNIAILSLRYPYRVILLREACNLPNCCDSPPLVPGLTQAHLCDTPFCNMSYDTCAISTKEFCDSIAARKARYETYLCWTSKFGVHTKWSCNRTLLRRVLRRFSNSKCFLEGFLEGAS